MVAFVLFLEIIVLLSQGLFINVITSISYKGWQRKHVVIESCCVRRYVDAKLMVFTIRRYCESHT